MVAKFATSFLHVQRRLTRTRRWGYKEYHLDCV